MMRADQPDLAGSVVLTGQVDDPAPELERASCLLHCAPREPFGMAVLEALAAGRPVVAPASDGPAEIVKDGCGILYPPGDAAAAASAVTRVLEQPELAASMGVAGRARAAERFGLERARREFAAALGPAAGRAPVGGSPEGLLALVTVTHNSEAELEALLESVAGHLPGARVVVVDSESADRTLEVARVARDGLRVQVIALSQNVGFGAACNEGVRAVSEPVVALVNPDVELLDDSLLSLAEEARRPPARLMAPLVLSPDGSRQDTAHALPGSAAAIAHALIPPAIVGPAAAPLGLAPWRARGPRRVGWAVGCALVASRETLLALGPFDERIFLYGEDLDLGLRARQAGIETWFWPAARVVHAGAHSTGREFGGEPFDLLARARHDVVAERMGPRGARIDDLLQTVTFGSRMVLKRGRARDADRERRQLAAIRSVRRSR
jgi:GT2 family glycosyltransferase